MGMKRKNGIDFKEKMKQLMPAYVIMFSFCFMLFIYEPILMYSTNKNDFWFDFGIMIFPTLMIFVLFFLMGTVFVTAFYFMVRIFRGKRANRIYQYSLVALSVIFLATYIQGVFLTTSLPVLTGERIEWDKYLKEDIITIVIWLILEILAACAVVKFSVETVIKWSCRISLAVMAMLVVGLLPQILSNDALKSKDALITTNTHFQDISSDQNFLIFLVDAVDAEVFDRVLEEHEEYRDIFRDFIYYENTASVYPYTRESVPFILTGEMNKNETAFEDYASEAYNHSPLFERLTKENYAISLYMVEPVWYGERSFDIVNDIKNSAASPYESMDFYMYFRQEMKYILFKYLPYAYKQYAQIDGFDFGRALEQYSYYDYDVYNSIVNHPELTKVDHNVFQYVHIEGAHLPFKVDKDLNSIENGTYTQKVEASIKVIDAYLARLKNNDAYDNSVIIIMADHGYYDVDHDSYGEEVLERFHPILLIKGFHEEHELERSDIPISHSDLMDAYLELMDGKVREEVFPAVDPNRKRTVIWQEYRGEDHMVEYELEGNDFKRQDFKLTGNVYDR